MMQNPIFVHQFQNKLFKFWPTWKQTSISILDMMFWFSCSLSSIEVAASSWLRVEVASTKIKSN